MQITPEQLLAEASQMALELRFKDQVIAQLQDEVARLQPAPAGQQQPSPGAASAGTAGGGSHSPGHVHGSPRPAGNGGKRTSGAAT